MASNDEILKVARDLGKAERDLLEHAKAKPSPYTHANQGYMQWVERGADLRRKRNAYLAVLARITR